MNQLFRTSGKIAFFFFILLTVVMAFATFYEKGHGTALVVQQIYGSSWFIACWFVLAAYAIFHIFLEGVHKRWISFCLHLTLSLILLGAFVTHFTSQSGTMYLREDTASGSFYEESAKKVALPFEIRLLSFRIDYYPGTESPADYISQVEVYDPASSERFEAQISMNKILKYKGYRFYQSSFDEDMKGSTLSVSRDIYGIPITYTGYFLLFLFMIIMLVDKKGTFRRLLRSPMLKKGTVLCIACLAAASSYASPLSDDHITINKEQAAHFEKIWVMYDGRICPMQTFARDFSLKLNGKPAYLHNNASQLLAGWLFFPEQWQTIELFKVENKEMQQLTGKETASFEDFYVAGKGYILEPYYKEMFRQGKQSAFIKEALRLDEKIQLINMLQSGHLLKIFPCNIDGRIQWLAPTDQLPDSLPEMEKLFIRGFISLYYSAITEGKDNEAIMLLDKLEKYQQSRGGDTIPSEIHRKIESAYNQSNLFAWLFKISLVIGLCSLIFFILQTLQGKEKKNIQHIFTILLLLIFLAHTLALACRTYIGGRLPLGNGFETMLFIAWCAMLIALCLRKYSLIIISFGLLISGFALLVAHLGMMNPKITPLVPVLSSPLLSIHVSLIMFSYALVGFMTMNSLAAFFILIFSKKEQAANIGISVEKLKILSEIFLYPAAFFMAAGIFIGAIWANVSWGRYWGWDPKEVWALITFMLMSLGFHSRTLKIFAGTFFFHVYMLIIFAAVLMTYFGVNYFLGGLHSYAGNADIGNSAIIACVVAGVLCVLIGWAYRKSKILQSHLQDDSFSQTLGK